MNMRYYHREKNNNLVNNYKLKQVFLYNFAILPP